MARRQHHNSISLFPFLAVLVCAMGSLILLLLVMTRKIRNEQDIEKSAMAATAPTTVASPDRSAEIADLEARMRAARETVASMQSQVVALTTRNEEHRVTMTAMQQELSDLEGQLAESSTHDDESMVADSMKLARQLKAREAALLRQLKESEKLLLEKRMLLEKATKAADEATLVLYEKNSALISLRARVETAEQQQKTVSGASTLLEFSNPTGTTRTPIVVDVSENGFEVLPNGIRITPADMEGFPVRDNPLLAAILTTHRHRSQNSVIGEPYVLLLVRPEGSLAFYGAQRVLIEAGIHYGYELLEADRTIVAGQPDPAEAPLVQASMNEAFRRRENLYAKLMALVQEKRELNGSGGGSQPGTGARRLMVRPDGRVVMDEGSGPPPLDGRFYAGGVAPPASHLRDRPVGGYGRPDSNRLTAEDAEKLADELAERYLKEQAAAKTAASEMPKPQIIAKGETGRSDEARRLPGEQKFAESLFGGDGSLQASPLVGRDGTRRQGSDLTSGSQPLASIGQLPPTANDERTRLGDGMPSSSSRLQSDDALFSGTTTRSSARTSKSEPPGTAVDNYDLPSSLLAGESGGSAASPGGSGKSNTGKEGSSAGIASDGPSTGIPDLSRVDPDLLQRLQSTKRPSGSLSTPVGVCVFLDEHHMTVSQQPAVEVTPETLDAAFSTLLTGINTEVEDVRRKPDEPLMPIVKFIVSPGGEKWRIPLAHSLKRMGIHSAAVFEVTPYMISTDNTGRASIDDEAEQL